MKIKFRVLFAIALLSTALACDPDDGDYGPDDPGGTDVPSEVIISLTHARFNHSAVALPNGAVVILGGTNNSGPVATAEIYDPTQQTFSDSGNLITARTLVPAALLADGRVLVSGGLDATQTALASAEIYDPSSGSFTATGAMPQALVGHTLTTLDDGTVLVTGGSVSTTPGANAYLYDPNAGTFSATGSLSVARSGHSATLLNDGRVLIAGGFSGTSGVVAGTAEIYDPIAKTFGATDNLTTPREGQTATLMDDGRVILTGGFDFHNAGQISPLNAVEIFDPSATSNYGAFSALSAMPDALYLQAATLLFDGTVAITGGTTTVSGSPTDGVESFDPVSAEVTDFDWLSQARKAHTATLLQDGGLLIVGGTSDSGPLSNCELLYY